MSDDTLTKPIMLAPYSLYVNLTQLLTPGFHWSIFLTDGTGRAMCYQWRTAQGRREDTDPAEEFAYGVIEPVTMLSEDNSLFLAFIRISSFTPPSGDTVENYLQLFHDIFPTSYANYIDNRKHGMSCRTWVLEALQRLRRAGHLSLTAEQVTGLEERIKAIGTAVEQRMAAGQVFSEITTL